MPEPAASTIRRAAMQLAVDADRAERKNRPVKLSAAEVRPIALWLSFEAECADGNAEDDPASEFALAVARTLLGEATDA